MNTIVKTLLTVWVSAVATFGFSSLYIVSQDSRINAPGELGEVFFATGFIILIALVVISGITLLVAKAK